MKPRNVKKPGRFAPLSVMAALGAGLLASACCLGPLGAVAAGIGGAWLSGFSVLEPYRPLFVGMALAALGVGWYREVRRSRACHCEACPPSKARWLLLGVGTVLVLGLLGMPLLVEPIHPAAMAQQPHGNAVQQPRESAVHEVVLRVKGMTCAACARTISRALRRLDGVRAAEVTLKPPEARVRFDSTKVSVPMLLKAIRDAGYDAGVKAEGLP